MFEERRPEQRKLIQQTLCLSHLKWTSQIFLTASSAGRCQLAQPTVRRATLDARHRWAVWLNSRQRQAGEKRKHLLNQEKLLVPFSSFLMWKYRPVQTNFVWDGKRFLQWPRSKVPPFNKQGGSVYLKEEKATWNTFWVLERKKNLITLHFGTWKCGSDVLLRPPIKFMLIGKWDKHTCLSRYFESDISISPACSRR